MSFLDVRVWRRFKASFWDKPPDAIVVDDDTARVFRKVDEFTEKKDIEVGAFAIKRDDGQLDFVDFIKGGEHEIYLTPRTELKIGEQWLGSLHSHPTTYDFSPVDFFSGLAVGERLSFVVAVTPGAVNMLVRTPNTRDVKDEQIMDLKEKYKDANIPDLAQAYNMWYYRGKGRRLELLSPKDVLTQKEITLAELVRNTEGLNDYPNSVKKVI